MMDEIEKIEETNALRNNRFRVILLIVYFCLLIIIYFVFVNVGVNPIVAFIILLFMFVLVIGPLLKGLRKSFYSRMFVDKKKKDRGGSQQSKEICKKKSKIIEYKPRKIRHVDLNITYRKPLIVKCNYCGMTVAGFVKKCPRCGELIELD